MKSKRPDSAAALVAASLPSADESRTTHELALKIKKKEEEIEEVERRNKLKLRTLAQVSILRKISSRQHHSGHPIRKNAFVYIPTSVNILVRAYLCLSPSFPPRIGK